MTYPVQKSDAEWQAILKDKGAEPVALQVTRHAATERPFTGKYEAHWAEGSYHCICCGAKLFDSVTKQPMPIGYGILSQEEVTDRIFQLTQIEPGSDY